METKNCPKCLKNKAREEDDKKDLDNLDELMRTYEEVNGDVGDSMKSTYYNLRSYVQTRA